MIYYFNDLQTWPARSTPYGDANETDHWEIMEAVHWQIPIYLSKDRYLYLITKGMGHDTE